MFSYRQGNEERVIEKVLSLLSEGKDVALCSDGGYPGISDPGYRLIRACAKASIPYDVVPGASAVEVALLMSGLSTSSFTFRRRAAPALFATGLPKTPTRNIR